MSNPMIANQIQSEIARLERELENLEARKKSLKMLVRNHRKALKLVGSDASAAADSHRASITGAAASAATPSELKP